MDVDIYRRGFKLVEYIYDNQIQDLELFRIRDVGNGLAESHWKSKQWLVDELSEFICNEDIHIAAGWLGLTGYLLRKEFPKNEITCSDMDPGCRVMGEFLFEGHNITYRTMDTVLDIKRIAPNCQVYINTSIEHIHQENVDKIISSLRPGTIVALQSNNYFSVADHVNCKNTLDEFTNSINLSHYLYTGEMEFKNYNRFMIIGIV